MLHVFRPKKFVKLPKTKSFILTVLGVLIYILILIFQNSYMCGTHKISPDFALHWTKIGAVVLFPCTTGVHMTYVYHVLQVLSVLSQCCLPFKMKYHSTRMNRVLHVCTKNIRLFNEWHHLQAKDQ